MQEIYPKFYKNFKCLANNCPNTCCKGWGVDIDALTLKKYKNVDGPYGAKLKNILSNHKQFFKVGATCPFLNKDGLCEIEINLGEDYLCDVCKKFPRVEYVYGKYVEHSLSCACCESARLLLENKLEFEVVESDKKIETYNTFDSKIFPYMQNARNFIFKVLNSNLTFDAKLEFLLDFGKYLQENFNIYSNIDKIIKEYDSKLPSYNDKITNHLTTKNIIKLIKKYMKLEMLTPFIYDKLDKLLHLIYNKRINDADLKNFLLNYKKIYEFNNIVIYFIYKYFLRCVYDYKIKARVEFSVYSVVILIMIAIFDTYTNGYFDTKFNIKNLEMFSREIEHNEINLKKLTKFFNKKTR